jgi:hypothetical protein
MTFLFAFNAFAFESTKKLLLFFPPTICSLFHLYNVQVNIFVPLSIVSCALCLGFLGFVFVLVLGGHYKWSGLYLKFCVHF